MQNPDPIAPPPARRSRRRLVIIAVLLIVLALAAVYFMRHRTESATPAHGRHGGAHAMAAAPQVVRVATARLEEIPIVRYALGTVTPLASVTVRPRIAGELQRIGFNEGQHVRRGDFLAQIDPRPTQASLRQAEGNLARDLALLEQARRDLERYRILLAQDSVARQTYDDQVSLVKQREGTVKADRADVDTYRLDLQYTRITSPIDGRVGLRQVDVGNYVQTGDTNGLVVITQTDPISVLFTLPEDDIGAIARRLRGGARLSASAYDRTNTTQLAVGALETIDNQIDTSTGTVRLRAHFANPDEALFPNQFVNIRLLVDTLRNVVVIPASAVQTGLIGQFVYLVKPDRTVTVRKITQGQTDGDRVAISAGLAAGDQVVIDGVDRLREGAHIALPEDAASVQAASQPGAHARRGAGGRPDNAASATPGRTATGARPASAEGAPSAASQARAG